MRKNTYSASLQALGTFVSGARGLAEDHASLSSGSGDLYAGTMGIAQSGVGAMGWSKGKGHGVIGVTLGAGTGTQAGVWGVIQDGSCLGWTCHDVSTCMVEVMIRAL